MLVDKKSIPWVAVIVGLFGVATALYVPYARHAPAGPSGKSWQGLTYGIIGTGLMAYAMLLAVKKRFRTFAWLGPAFVWMQGHVWLSLLSYPLILYHAGFRWGQPGNLTWVMMWVFTLVVASGVYGVIVQQILPRLMIKQVPRETIYDQIDSVISQLAREAAAIAGRLEGLEEELIESPGDGGVAVAVPSKPIAAARQRVKAFYTTEVSPYLGSSRGRGCLLSDANRSASVFDELRRSSPDSLTEVLADLQDIVEERRQLERQRSLHHWLHSWLLMHVPLSYALTVLTLVHIIGALRFR